jgi:lysophospholipase L1-like esterase
MKSLTVIMLAGITAGLMASATGARAADRLRQGSETGSWVELKTNLTWATTPDLALPDVLILGDSISIGYTLPVRKILAGQANVYRPISPDGKRAVNCLGTRAGVKQIDHWLSGHHWAVIYFNWGLHDLKHVTAVTGSNSNNPNDPPQATLAEYRRNLELIVARLKATGARLIFATTTPVSAGTLNPLRDPGAPARYNAAALEIMNENGVQVDDLFALCQPRLNQLQLPHNVHFNSTGFTLLARHVATVIQQVLPAASADRAGQSTVKKGTGS